MKNWTWNLTPNCQWTLASLSRTQPRDRRFGSQVNLKANLSLDTAQCRGGSPNSPGATTHRLTPAGPQATHTSLRPSEREATMAAGGGALCSTAQARRPLANAEMPPDAPGSPRSSHPLEAGSCWVTSFLASKFLGFQEDRTKWHSSKTGLSPHSNGRKAESLLGSRKSTPEGWGGTSTISMYHKFKFKLRDLVTSTFGNDYGIQVFVWIHLGISLALTLHSELDTSRQGPNLSTCRVTVHNTGLQNSQLIHPPHCPLAVLWPSTEGEQVGCLVQPEDPLIPFSAPPWGLGDRSNTRATWMEVPLPMPSTPCFQETLPPCTKRHPCGSCSISPLTLVPPCQPRKGESTQRSWAQCWEHRLWFNGKASPAVRTLTDSGSPKATVLHTQFLPDVQAGVLECRVRPSLPSWGQLPLPATASPARQAATLHGLPSVLQSELCPSRPQGPSLLVPSIPTPETHSPPAQTPLLAPFSTELSLVSPLRRPVHHLPPDWPHSQGGHHHIQYEWLGDKRHTPSPGWPVVRDSWPAAGCCVRRGHGALAGGSWLPPQRG